MIKVPVYTLEGTKKSTIELLDIFSTPFRPDVIHKVYTAIATHVIQPQGRDLMAGEKTSARTYRPPTGRGVARVPRVKGERYSRAGQAAGIASVVKGRQAHPPKSEKIIYKYVNLKEKKLATESCIAATANKELVKLRGHKTDGVLSIPLIVSDEIQSIKKSKELHMTLEKLGLGDDLMRVNRKKIGKGPLIVISEDNGVRKASENITGIECVYAKDVNVLDLAPGCQPGRLVIWSKSALNDLKKRFEGVS